MDRRGFLETSAAVLAASAIPGCSSFFKTDYITKKSEEFIKTRNTIFDKYKADTVLIIREYGPRKEMPFWSVNEDDISTLYYTVAYGNQANIAASIAKLLPDVTIDTDTGLRQLAIKVKKDSQRSELEELLFQRDRYPEQSLVILEIRGQLGDLAKDYASTLELLLKNQGKNYTAITGQGNLPGSEPRVIARGDMLNRWGLTLGLEDFNLEATLDMLQINGMVVNLYSTEMTIINGDTEEVGQTEKLLIPVYKTQGIQILQTYDLADVISSIKITSYVGDGSLRLGLEATLGGTKRPEVRERVEVPTSDTVKIPGVIVNLGQPISVAAYTRGQEIGIVRKNPFAFFPSGQDYEIRLNRMWFTLTPRGIIWYDPATLIRPKIEVVPLGADLKQAAKKLTLPTDYTPKEEIIYLAV